MESLDPYLEGPTGIAFGADEISAREGAGGLRQGVREAGPEGGVRGRPCVRAGWNQELAQLPPREVLLASSSADFARLMQGVVGVLWRARCGRWSE